MLSFLPLLSRFKGWNLLLSSSHPGYTDNYGLSIELLMSSWSSLLSIYKWTRQQNLLEYSSLPQGPSVQCVKARLGQNHLSWKGTIKDRLVQLPCNEQGHLHNIGKMTLYSLWGILKKKVREHLILLQLRDNYSCWYIQFYSITRTCRHKERI